MSNAYACAGQRIGQYEIVRRISIGGMAEVFLAFDRGIAGFGRPLVVTRLLPAFARDEALVRMFLHEAKIASEVRHPNIAQVFDLGYDNGELYQVVEFIPGATLMEIRRATHAARDLLPIC